MSQQVADELISERRSLGFGATLHQGKERPVVRNDQADRPLRLPCAARAGGEHARRNDGKGEDQCKCSAHFDSFRGLTRQATFTCGSSVAIVKRPSRSSATTRTPPTPSIGCSAYSSSACGG